MERGLIVASAPANVSNFCIADQCLGQMQVHLMDFDKLSAEIGSPVAGIIGEDVLSKFTSVTICYKKGFVIFARD